MMFHGAAANNLSIALTNILRWVVPPVRVIGVGHGVRLEQRVDHDETPPEGGVEALGVVVQADLGPVGLLRHGRTRLHCKGSDEAGRVRRRDSGVEPLVIFFLRKVVGLALRFLP